tara:strand:- start:1261 stop:2067 length:807 start_codon:yes stop_codon:yes gene_type:complete
MSSIYRKGRDGYFYYQTYIKNSKTGKKDKRKFHSLGTKDENEAKKMQMLLDKKYAQVGVFYKTKKFKYLAIFAIFSFLSFIMIQKNSFQKLPTIEKNNKIISDQENLNEDQLSEDNQNIKNPNNIDISNKIKNHAVSVEMKGLKTKVEENLNFDVANPNLIYPEYTIRKIETISENFSQGRIFATIQKGVSSDILFKVCEEIKSQYTQYSNIVICIFSETSIGVGIAKGNYVIESTQEYNNAWLAMYTFNSIEGAYFDDDPSGYLGGF